MRLEIIVPDSTSQDVKRKLTNLTERLSAHPELADELVTETVAEIPVYLGVMDQALQSPNRFRSGAAVDAYLNELRSEW